MPSYEYLHKTDCGETWEDWRSIVDCFPDGKNIKCPKCGAADNIELQVSGGSGKGHVELSGQEFKAKVKEDAKQFRKDVYANEKMYANIIGEGKYEGLQTKIDRHKR